MILQEMLSSAFCLPSVCLIVLMFVVLILFKGGEQSVATVAGPGCAALWWTFGLFILLGFVAVFLWYVLVEM